jgi:hypothetical protein
MIEIFRHGCTLEIVIGANHHRQEYRKHLRRLGAEVEPSGGASLQATWPTEAKASSAQRLLTMTAEKGVFDHNEDTAHARR